MKKYILLHLMVFLIISEGQAFSQEFRSLASENSRSAKISMCFSIFKDERSEIINWIKSNFFELNSSSIAKNENIERIKGTLENVSKDELIKYFKEAIRLSKKSNIVIHFNINKTSVEVEGFSLISKMDILSGPYMGETYNKLHKWDMNLFPQLSYKELISNMIMSDNIVLSFQQKNQSQIFSRLEVLKYLFAKPMDYKNMSWLFPDVNENILSTSDIKLIAIAIKVREKSSKIISSREELISEYFGYEALNSKQIDFLANLFEKDSSIYAENISKMFGKAILKESNYKKINEILDLIYEFQDHIGFAHFDALNIFNKIRIENDKDLNNALTENGIIYNQLRLQMRELIRTDRDIYIRRVFRIDNDETGLSPIITRLLDGERQFYPKFKNKEYLSEIASRLKLSDLNTVKEFFKSNLGSIFEVLALEPGIRKYFLQIKTYIEENANKLKEQSPAEVYQLIENYLGYETLVRAIVIEPKTLLTILNEGKFTSAAQRIGKTRDDILNDINSKSINTFVANHLSDGRNSPFISFSKSEYVAIRAALHANYSSDNPVAVFKVHIPKLSILIEGDRESLVFFELNGEARPELLYFTHKDRVDQNISDFHNRYKLAEEELNQGYYIKYRLTKNDLLDKYQRIWAIVHSLQINFQEN